VGLAEPTIAAFAILDGQHHARLIPGRNALAKYPARLTFFFAWRFSGGDVIPGTQAVLTLLRGHGVEGCPPLFNVLALAVGTDNPAFLILRKCHGFREFFIAGSTKEIVLGHDFPPHGKLN